MSAEKLDFIGNGLITEKQTPEIEQKIDLFREADRSAINLDILRTIYTFSDEITNLENLDAPQKVTVASDLAITHMNAFDEYKETDYEYQMAYVILEGISHDASYRLTIENNLSPDLETSLAAAQVLSDRRTVEKAERKMREAEILEKELGAITDIPPYIHPKIYNKTSEELDNVDEDELDVAASFIENKGKKLEEIPEYIKNNAFFLGVYSNGVNEAIGELYIARDVEDVDIPDEQWDLARHRENDVAALIKNLNDNSFKKTPTNYKHIAEEATSQLYSALNIAPPPQGRALGHASEQVQERTQQLAQAKGMKR